MFLTHHRSYGSSSFCYPSLSFLFVSQRVFEGHLSEAVDGLRVKVLVSAYGSRMGTTYLNTAIEASQSEEPSYNSLLHRNAFFSLNVYLVGSEYIEESQSGGQRKVWAAALLLVVLDTALGHFSGRLSR